MSPGLQLALSFFPPTLSPGYIRALLEPLFETLALALGAVTAAVVIGLPLALAVALRLPGARLLVGALSLVRGVPDVTLAVLCVILFGLGTGAGLVALAIYYTATIARMFTDLLLAVPQPPVEALAATGAGRFQRAAFAILPLAAPDLFAYGAFALECALRSAIIVGAVGAGGIGTELVGTLNAFDFHRALTVIMLLMAVIALLDRVAVWLARHPRALIVPLLLGVVALYVSAPEMIAAHHATGVFATMLPPHLEPDEWRALPAQIAQTLAMAAIATIIATALALIAALPASRRLAPRWLAFIMRRIFEVFRTVPEYVWGLMLIAIAGVGLGAGIGALALHSFGSFGRVFADAFDNAAEAPQHALTSTGATRTQVALFGTLPLAMRTIGAHVAFRFDWNLRMAAVLGLIGAGGIGQALYQDQQLFFYDRVLAYVLITAVMILATELATRRWLMPSPTARLAGVC